MATFTRSPILLARSNEVSDQPAVSPKVAIVVLNWNGWSDTVECLSSLVRGSYPFHQIVACDNGSTDDSLMHLQRWARDEGIPFGEYNPQTATFTKLTDADAPLVFVRLAENLGYAGGNNVGIRYALDKIKADYIWILNNDTVVDQNALAELVALAESNRHVGVLGARVLQYWRPTLIQALGGGRISRSGMDTQIGRDQSEHPREDEEIELDHVVGASMFVRADAIRTVGYIDERYFLYREETDWCIKMRQANWKLVYCPNAFVWHKEGASLGYKSELHDYYAVRNLFFLVQEHYPQYLPFTLIYWLFRGFGPKLLRLQFRRISYVWRAYRDFFRGIDGKSDTFARYWQLVHLTTRKPPNQTP